MPKSSRSRRADQAAALRDPFDCLILAACRREARTVQQLAADLAASSETVRQHIRRLTELNLLMVEAPSRIAGRLIIPYRTSPYTVAVATAHSRGSRGTQAGS